ncbi:MAG: bifunctional alpha,alpha-trehalose-phosphate synthase (UDP-forming)/trehalose-phosphatase [Blastocatellia bacterium]|nr:bifunctional alpha,alpha-trehalose-phosphate synthase (UDP-forming)/trehalose-phosphatase [Blastocatellia bacterium]
MSRLLIVSNRLPITVSYSGTAIEIQKSAGGLASGLKKPHETSDSLWFGWPGDVSAVPRRQRAELETTLQELRTIPIFLSHQEINQFYEGFSNGVLWPLFHYLLDKVDLDSVQDWKTYVAVNRRFAETVCHHYRPGDTIWVHDYQLALVPGMIRERFPKARIGFFLHIPFPSSEVFRILPWREEILRGLLGADLIGFHTYAYSRHFATALLHVLGVQTEVEQIRYQERLIHLGAFPMGIDTEKYSSLAASSGVQSRCSDIRQETGNCQVFLSIDRLDYTKGIVRRLLAFHQLLIDNPDLPGRVRFIQVVVPSRTKVESYAHHRKTIDELVGRINSTYGSVGSVPIHYLFRCISDEELVALYLATDVMLVTPVRDGMNLVAKEFVAARNDENGVLLLSEFAGVAAEFGEALQVNPFDVEQVSNKMREALLMSIPERQTRMQALRRRVFTSDVHHWVQAFLDKLDQCPQTLSETAFSPLEAIQQLTFRLNQVPQLVLFLDYDGTLVNFRHTPQLAAPDQELLQILTALSHRPQTEVHIVSGRQRQVLEQWFGTQSIGLHAEHGCWSRYPGQTDWASNYQAPVDWKTRVLPILEQYTAQTPGALIEEKTAGLTWHYRMANPEFGPLKAKELQVHLVEVLSNLPVEVLKGEKIVEVRAQGVNKGQIVQQVCSQVASSVAVPVAIGDDRTDEDMFLAIPENGVTIHVGETASLGTYRFASPATVRYFLRQLITSPTGTHSTAVAAG